MNITETPDKWVILELPDNNYKVFGTWAGGYLDGDRWQLNSGIKEVEQDDDYYYFTGFSGSCYKCKKKSYGFATSYGESVLNNLLKAADNKIKLLENTDNWKNF